MDKRLEQMKLKESALSHEYLTKVLNYEPETGIFTWKIRASHAVKPGMTAGTLNKNGYIFIKVGTYIYRAHRLAWFYVYGEWPSIDNYQIDHIDGNRANNAIKNLRLINNSKNARNHGLYKSNTSGVTGVFFDNTIKKWKAVIHCNIYNKDNKRYRLKLLGNFTNFKDAVKARKKAEEKYGYIIR